MLRARVRADKMVQPTLLFSSRLKKDLITRKTKSQTTELAYFYYNVKEKKYDLQ